MTDANANDKPAQATNTKGEKTVKKFMVQDYSGEYNGRGVNYMEGGWYDVPVDLVKRVEESHPGENIFSDKEVETRYQAKQREAGIAPDKRMRAPVTK